MSTGFCYAVVYALICWTMSAWITNYAMYTLTVEPRWRRILDSFIVATLITISPIGVILHEPPYDVLDIGRLFLMTGCIVGPCGLSKTWRRKPNDQTIHEANSKEK